MAVGTLPCTSYVQFAWALTKLIGFQAKTLDPGSAFSVFLSHSMADLEGTSGGHLVQTPA